MSKYDLVAVGNPVYDIIQTPKIKVSGRVLSGCSTNACLAARKLGIWRVALVGSIGSDYRSRFQDDLTRYGIKGFIVHESDKSGGFKLVYDEAGDRTLDVLGVAGNITTENFPDEYLDTQVILLGPILAEVDVTLIEYIRTSSKAKVFLDPQGLLRKIGPSGRIVHSANREELSRIVGMVDFVKPNEQEALVMTGKREAEAARQLSEWGAPVAIVTLADRGSVVLGEGGFYRIPAFKAEAVDPTGAGDVYAGSFIFYLLKHANLKEAAIFASAAASVMVESLGPDFPLTLETAMQRMKTLLTEAGAV